MVQPITLCRSVDRKKALAGTFQSILKDKEVYLAVNWGFGSWTFFHHNVQRVQDAITNRCNGEPNLAHVLYFGDMDLAGDDIAKHLDEMKRYFGLDGVDFQKAGVNNTSIKYHFMKMGLQYNEEDKTIPTISAKPPKVRNVNNIQSIQSWRTRVNRYKKRRGSDATIQLDGFLATDRKAFERLVLGSVGKYFDPIIYKKYQLQQKKEMNKIPSLVKRSSN